MEIYLITLLFIFVFGFLDLRINFTNLQRNGLLFFLYILIVLQIGLRWETGTDWKPYLENFETSDDYNIVLLNALTEFEIGYGTLVFFIKKIFNSFSFFLFIHALFYYWCIFKATIKYSPYPFIALLFFYATNLGVVGSNRQLLAIVFCLLSLQFVIQRKLFKFIVTIVIASLFHTTAFLFGIYYFLNRNFKTVTIVSILVLSFIIGKTGLPFLFFSKFGVIFGDLAASKTLAYTEKAKDDFATASLSVFGLIKRLSFIVIFTFNYHYLTKRLTYYKLLYNGYVLGMVVYFLFASTLLIIVNRGSMYFNIMECFLVSCQFFVFRKRLDRGYIYFILFILSIIFLYQSISPYSDLFDPYKGLFYNSDFVRDMH